MAFFILGNDVYSVFLITIKELIFDCSSYETFVVSLYDALVSAFALELIDFLKDRVQFKFVSVRFCLNVFV
jgi:hypothetical protein